MNYYSSSSQNSDLKTKIELLVSIFWILNLISCLEDNLSKGGAAYPTIPQYTFIVTLILILKKFLNLKKDNKYSLFQKLGNFIYNSSQSHATYFNEYNTKLAKKKKKASLHFLFSSKCWLNIQKYSLQILYRKYSAAEFLLIQTCLWDSQTLAVLKQDCVGKGRGSYVYICEVTMVRGGAISQNEAKEWCGERGSWKFHGGSQWLWNSIGSSVLIIMYKKKNIWITLCALVTLDHILWNYYFTTEILPISFQQLLNVFF